ncbi:oligopeptide/dipeptide ABC transporter ATP-binding protein [Arenibaculum sp.]|jgi:peptide/nickel transport system ATP-binding protein|uniref:ABC transporter ATP-binding protein n=1 Tax=Arenibaculum sp. TaxID=2865862 RepID=UPI002E0EADB0|nr:oligopeptide/dipeptide ABC transporter ATP-binding protein [Arenibaculum sp.]
MTGTADTLLRVEGLKKHFPLGHSRDGVVVKAVDDVSFNVGRGRIVGLVGESGSGKTTVSRAILRLIEPTGGRVVYDGTDVMRLDARALRRFRRHMQIIFQDPYSSLNPRMTIEEIIGEALTAQAPMPAAERRDRTARLLERVGLGPEQMRRYPHEFSGGQRQRIGIARALAVEPGFVIADEAVSALDVSVQAQVLNLLQDLQQELGLTMLFIAHDLAVVEYLCDEIVVLYLGRIMEIGPTDAVCNDPRHPYTRALLSAAPVPDPTADRKRLVLAGDIPSPIAAPSGCVFRTRCPYAVADCAAVVPPLRETAPGRFSACILEDIG